MSIEEEVRMRSEKAVREIREAYRRKAYDTGSVRDKQLLSCYAEGRAAAELMQSDDPEERETGIEYRKRRQRDFMELLIKWDGVIYPEYPMQGELYKSPPEIIERWGCFMAGMEDAEDA